MLEIKFYGEKMTCKMRTQNNKLSSTVKRKTRSGSGCQKDRKRENCKSTYEKPTLLPPIGKENELPKGGTNEKSNFLRKQENS